MDPIECLRSGIVKGRKIERKEGRVHIGNYIFPETTFTCMKKLQTADTEKDMSENAYYSLDSIVLFWTVFSDDKNVDQGSYALQCADENVIPISFPQKASLLNFLNGKAESCIYFDLNVPFRFAKPESFASAAAAAKTPGAASNASTNMSMQSYKRLRAVLGNEKVYETRSKVIAVNAKSSFTEALEMMKREEKSALPSRVDEEWQGRMNVSSMNINPEEGFLTQTADHVDAGYTQEAIIIVSPCAGSNVITMFNVEQFMEHGVYVPSEEMKTQLSLKPQEIIIIHSINNRKMRFRFIDNASRLSTDEWSRVVCVLVGTQMWQFKGWKVADPALLFNQILGVFMWFTEMQIPTVVKGWNVQTISINRDVRNMDAVAMVQFWDMVEKTIKTKKTDLLK